MRSGVFLNGAGQFCSFLWIPVLAFGMIFGEAAYAETPGLYEAKGRRDPFVQLVSMTSRQSSGLLGVEAADEVRVEGVVYDPPNGSVVITNGSVLKEGESVGSVKVLKIKADGVLLLVNGTETFKPIYQDDAAKRKQAEND